MLATYSINIPGFKEEDVPYAIKRLCIHIYIVTHALNIFIKVGLVSKVGSWKLSQFRTNRSAGRFKQRVSISTRISQGT